MEVIICKQCNNKFEVYPFRKDVAKFCSSNCHGKWMSKNQSGKNAFNYKGKIRWICEQCGDKFETYFYRIKEKVRFCSRICSGQWKSVNLRGDKSHMWRGGITEKKWRTKTNRYKLWRKSVFERDVYRCVICGKIGGFLIGHHIKNWKPFPELRFKVDNGITVCKDCHGIVNKEFPLFSIRSREVKNV